MVMLAPGTTLPGQSYISYAAPFKSCMVAIKRVSVSTGAITYVSGIQIDSRHVITTCHGLDSTSGIRPLSNLSVLIGDNILTPSVEINIRRCLIHPDYRSYGQGEDIAILELAEEVPNRGVELGNYVAINNVIQMAGYGQAALSDGALQPLDGFLRAFDSFSNGSSLSWLPDEHYNQATPFEHYYPLLPFAGFGAQYDSGGGVFLNGKLVGIIVAATESWFGEVGCTWYLDTTRPTILAHIEQFRKYSVGGAVGFNFSLSSIEPASASNGPTLSGVINGGAAGRVVRIESTIDLVNPDSWETIAAVTLDRSGSATIQNLTDGRVEAINTKSYFVRATLDP